MILYQKDTDNIVTLTLDMAGRDANILNHEIAKAFVPIMRHLQEEKRKRQLRGVILTSAKKTFMAGGDLEYLNQAVNPLEVFQYSQTLKQLFRDIERPGVPVVAALNGTALGMGFELALACHHRIAIDHPKLRLGFSEVNFGLMPGNGGVIRLMWLLGIEKAFPILTKGKRYAPQQALKVGIIDDLAIDEKDLMQKAKSWLLKTVEARRLWDQAGEKIPVGAPNDPQHIALINRLTAHVMQQYRDNFPAPKAILSTLIEGSKVDFDTACRIESRYYAQLLCGKEAKNMIQAFWFDTNKIVSGLQRPKGFGKFRPRKVGIIGAGQMGSGIATSCLIHGMEVVLKDVSKLIAERGRTYVKNRLTELTAIGKITPEEQQMYFQRIQTTETSTEFETCDLVIEAVFENENVKKKVTKEAENCMDEYSFFASNTISIPITKLAESSIRPAHYVGLHFFAPAEKVPLVEIVKGKNTSDETIARAFDFVKKIRKIPIIVKDDWGFYAMRVQNTYILEGITMLQEGYAPAVIENLGKQAGMPKGALAFADDLGLAMVLKYENQAAAHYGPRYVQHPAVPVLEKMLSELERPGKRKKTGFYEYEKGDIKGLWEALTIHFPNTQSQFFKVDIMDRFLFSQVLEALWCLHEKVISTAPEANLGSIYGWGFPAFKGGVIQFVKDYGKEAFIAKCQTLEEEHGPRFKVPGWLKEYKI